MKLPNLLILGVQKSATTTLFDILKKTKGFSSSSEKEIHFFDNDANYQKGLNWYLDFFEDLAAPIIFEATPSYIYSKNAAERIFNSLGKIKFIVIVRDPVRRCYSAWNMFRTFHDNPATAKYVYDHYLKSSNCDVKIPLKKLLFSEKFPSFRHCVEEDLDRWRNNDVSEEPSFVRRGFYYQQIIKFFKYYDIENFLFLEYEDFKKNDAQILGEIYKFLDLNPRITKEHSRTISNQGDYVDTRLSENSSTLLDLYDIYKKSNHNFFSLIGKEYSWNSSWLEK